VIKGVRIFTTLSDKPPVYYSYILRCWVEAQLAGSGEPLCRYSLEDPHTGERLVFASLELLTEFLRARANECAEGKSATRKDEGRRTKT